jgi:hypothetical protein
MLCQSSDNEGWIASVCLEMCIEMAVEQPVQFQCCMYTYSQRLRKTVVLQEQLNLQLWLRSNALVSYSYKQAFAVQHILETRGAVVVIVERFAIDVAQADIFEVVGAESGLDVCEDVRVLHRGRDDEVVDSGLVLGAVELYDAGALGLVG